MRPESLQQSAQISAFEVIPGNGEGRTAEPRPSSEHRYTNLFTTSQPRPGHRAGTQTYLNLRGSQSAQLTTQHVCTLYTKTS